MADRDSDGRDPPAAAVPETGVPPAVTEGDSQERLSFALEAANMASWEWDLGRGRIVWSMGFERLLGAGMLFDGSREAFLGCVHAEDRDLLLGTFERRLEDGAEYEVDFRLVWEDGTVRWARARGRVFFDRQGRAGRMVGVLTDVTEQKGLEDRFRQVQRLQTVGRLAGGVAHDFNNLLTVVGGYTNLAMSEVEPGESLYECLEEIRKAAERGAQLTSRLLAFGRQEVAQQQILDLGKVIADIENMLVRLIGEDVAVVIRGAGQVGSVRADPGQLEQVLMNLATNARDAMPEGGRLTIQTENVDVTPSLARRHANLRPGPHVLLSVADSGCGMDGETRQRLFEPFYTTKAGQGGIGLGLSTVYGIVEQNAGAIEVDSAPGQGARFRIYLPRVDVPAEAVAPGPEPTPRAGGGETVLVVEDEEDVRNLLVALLRRNGYRLIAAPGGEEALRVSRGQQGDIDLLLTDVVMPGMNGPEVAERLSRERPGLRVLFISGYAADELREDVLSPGRGFLQKPFSTEGLLGKIREVLAVETGC